MDDFQTAPPATTPTDGPHTRGRRPAVLVGAALVAVALVAAAVWVFTAGPLSPRARTEREVEDALRELGTVTTFADFNSRMCEQNRLPQDLVDTIAQGGRQTGQDVDAVFREQTMSRFPRDLDVREVTLDGESATATVRTSSGAADEQVHLLREGGRWTICESGVGAGSLPR